MSIIPRSAYLEAIQNAFRSHPICALLGPRQCGKTTLAQQYVKDHKGSVHYYDLEDPDDIKIFDNPNLVLEHLKGLIVIDEVQRSPDLFPYLRVLVDRHYANERSGTPLNFPSPPIRFALRATLSPEGKR